MAQPPSTVLTLLPCVFVTDAIDKPSPPPSLRQNHDLLHHREPHLDNHHPVPVPPPLRGRTPRPDRRSPQCLRPPRRVGLLVRAAGPPFHSRYDPRRHAGVL